MLPDWMPVTVHTDDNTILIRSYYGQDEGAIEEITYRTGFQGDDLTGRRFFDDRRLFFLIFIYYYTRHEPQHCFVAVDSADDAVVGFICGTPDTAVQEVRFLKTTAWRIPLRVFFYTIWRYPKTFLTFLRLVNMARYLDRGKSVARLEADYPAHLHMNVLPGYQAQGIGTQLMQRFERHMMALDVRGIHLQTSNHNHKALPFYKKMGFAIVSETRADAHPAAEGLVLLTFAKRLDGERLVGLEYQQPG
jgi:ribosomal protein S18 acetylase RimI-like enzyme